MGVSAWTFDELYGRDGKFLDGLESRAQVFVGEIPSNFHGWVQKPEVVSRRRPRAPKQRKAKGSVHVSRRRPSCEVRNLVKYSPRFRAQSWQRYRIKDTDKGPEVWEVKWAVFWRKDAAGLPTRRQVLMVARNVLSGEVKYFLANRVPGEGNAVAGKYVTLRGLLHVAFSRCTIERCFRESKDELGMDHYQVRGWQCLRRHFYVTQLTQLFCARVRQEYDQSSPAPIDRLTVEQVCSAMNVWLNAADLCATCRRQRFEAEIEKQQYYQQRNQEARQSHTETRLRQLRALGIDVDRIRSCIPDQQPL